MVNCLLTTWTVTLLGRKVSTLGIFLNTEDNVLKHICTHFIIMK